MIEASNFLGQLTPLQFFSTWLNEAKKSNLQHADAFVLSTVNENLEPSSRVLLIKDIAENHFTFYTNYESRKGKEILNNPNVAINFFWDTLWRQVCFRGLVTKMTKEESEKYWLSRPRASQLSQWVSQQSKPVTSREQMERELKNAELQFKDKPVPLPSRWGGFIFTPTYVEFWIGREGRFHDRYAYLKVENSWRGQRLYP